MQKNGLLRIDLANMFMNENNMFINLCVVTYRVLKYNFSKSERYKGTIQIIFCYLWSNQPPNAGI